MDKIPFSKKTHIKFYELVYNHAGINLIKKKELLRTRLLKRMNKLNIKDYDKYFDYVINDKTGKEFGNMLAVVSTNYTLFFRENAHFKFLEQKIIPEIFTRENPYIRCWSAASSSGEEAYSILITLMESNINLNSYDFKLLGTDISSKVINLAQKGEYALDKLDNMNNYLKNKYFYINKKNETAAIKEFVKSHVRFKIFNLMSKTYPFSRQFDFIFCRNVIIYFDKSTQQKLMDKLYYHLKPGGYLLIGHSESLTGIKHNFKYIQPTIYQKPK